MIKFCAAIILLAIHCSCYAKTENVIGWKIDTTKKIYSLKVGADGFRTNCKDSTSIKSLIKISSISILDSTECRIHSSSHLSFDSNGIALVSQSENGLLLFSGSHAERFSIYAKDIIDVNQKEEYIDGEPGVFKKSLPLVAPYLIASGVIFAIVYIGLYSSRHSVSQ